MKSISEFLKQWLTGSRAYIGVFLCAVILLLPSVFTGFSGDDYFLRTITLQHHDPDCSFEITRKLVQPVMPGPVA